MPKINLIVLLALMLSAFSCASNGTKTEEYQAVRQQKQETSTQVLHKKADAVSHLNTDKQVITIANLVAKETSKLVISTLSKHCSPDEDTGRFQCSNIEGSLTPSKNNDYWQQVRGGFGLDANLDQVLVKKYIAYYKTKKDAVYKLSQRAAVFLPFVLKEARMRRMPTEIALLPFFKSGFSPKAMSKNGSAGLWGLSKGVATAYGLRIDENYDGRLNPLKSTQVSLDYLSVLSSRFNDDWLLALAAYNLGEKQVLSALESNRKNNQSTNFWSLPIPSSAKHEAAKLLAYREIIKNTDDYGIRLIAASKFISLEALRINKPLDLTMLSASNNANGNIIVRLNPGFANGIVSPTVNPWLLVPTRYYTQIDKALKSGDYQPVKSYPKIRPEKPSKLDIVSPKHSKLQKQSKSPPKLDLDGKHRGQLFAVK